MTDTPTHGQATLDRLCINTVRTLSIDAVQRAHSGHPGTPMDAAPTVYCLWQCFLRYDPAAPDWPNRDRFVLSNGHASAMLYSLIATGSEVALCVAAYEQLAAEGIKARVVSMPSWELFEGQSQAYRDRVLPPDVSARVAVEEASTFGWERYTGPRGATLGMHTFGLSAPLKVVQQHFGFTPEHVVAAAKAQIGRYHEIDRERSGK